MTGYEIEHNLEQRLRSWSLDPVEQLLYLKLKIIANEMGLITQKFKVSNAELQFRVGISKSKLCSARDNLVKSGILGYKSGGKDGNKKTFGEYWFIDLRYLIKTTTGTTTDTTTDTTNLTLNKTKTKTENIPPIPPKGDDDKPSWKKKYEVYLEELRNEYRKVISDDGWMEQQMKFNPGVDIQKSIEKACVNYWATEAGWKKKKRSQITDIDWRSTFANAISQKTNRVYINDLFQNHKLDKYEQKRIDSEQRKFDSISRIQQLDEEWINSAKRKELEASLALLEISKKE